MLDELLGRASLRERIEELEADLEAAREAQASAEERLEAEERRRREAVSARQDAQEEVNALEDRIAQLEGTVERLRDGETELIYRGTERLDRRATERVLDALSSVEVPPDGALTAVVTEGRPPAVEEAFGGRAALVDRASPCVAVADEHGLVSAALRPPALPPMGVRWGATFDLEREHFLPTGEFAFALVRSDRFAIGEYRDDERVAFEGFESDVKGNHSKGGYSQGRFERRRDAQIDEHLEDCERAIADRDADRLYLAGDRGSLDALDVGAEARATVDATGKTEAALDDAFESFWTTTLYLL